MTTPSVTTVSFRRAGARPWLAFGWCLLNAAFALTATSLLT